MILLWILENYEVQKLFCLGTSLGEYLVFQIPSFNQIKPFEDLNDLESYC